MMKKYCILSILKKWKENQLKLLNENAFYQNIWIPLLESPCKIYIRPEFQDRIKHMFQRHGRCVEFIGNELEEGYVLK